MPIKNRNQNKQKTIFKTINEKGKNTKRNWKKNDIQNQKQNLKNQKSIFKTKNEIEKQYKIIL